MEERLRELGEEKGELEEQQEILQWEKHQTALQIISAEEKERTSELTKDLLAWKRQLEECRKTIQGYEEICKQYDEILNLLEVLRKQEAEEEQKLEAAREQITDCMDEWIEAVYGSKRSERMASGKNGSSACGRKNQGVSEQYGCRKYTGNFAQGL